MALREILARFGFDIDQAGLAAANLGITGVIGKMQAFGAVIAGTMVVRGITNFVDGMIDSGAELHHTSTMLGIGETSLFKWQGAAKLAGVEAESVTMGFRLLARHAYEASEKGGDAEKMFKKMGVSVKDSSGHLKSNEQLMYEVGSALGEVKGSTERTAMAQKLFGRSGAALIPLFKDGKKGLDELMAVMDQYSGNVEEFVHDATAAKKATKLWGLATGFMKRQLAIALLPAITAVITTLAKGIGWIAKFTAGTKMMQAILVTLGFAIAQLAIAKFGGDLLSLGRAVVGPLLKFAILVLLLDDFFTMLAGGDSVLGRFLDKLFGPGASSGVADTISAITDSLKAGDFDNALGLAADALENLGGSIVRFFSGESTSPIAEFFSVVGEKIVAFFVDTVPQVLSDAAKSAKEGALSVGKGIIDGIVDAIKSGAGAIADAASEAVSAALNKVKSILKIHSPSEVAGDEIGEPLGEGVAVGWRRALEGAAMGRDAVSAMTASAPTSATAPRSPMAGMGSGGVIFQTEVNLSVSGNPSDGQVTKLRQGLRTELNDNRQAMLAALQQTVEVPT